MLRNFTIHYHSINYSNVMNIVLWGIKKNSSARAELHGMRHFQLIQQGHNSTHDTITLFIWYERTSSTASARSLYTATLQQRPAVQSCYSWTTQPTRHTRSFKCCIKNKNYIIWSKLKQSRSSVRFHIVSFKRCCIKKVILQDCQQRTNIYMHILAWPYEYLKDIRTNNQQSSSYSNCYDFPSSSHSRYENE